MRWSYIILPIIILLSLLGCAQPSVKPVSTGEETKLIYQCQAFWAEEEFSELSESDLRARFRGKYNVDARNFGFSFDKATHSTIIKCQIYGAISKGHDRYTADFLWFLNPLGLDFIGDNFKESKHGLSWEGSVDGVPTSIKI